MTLFFFRKSYSESHSDMAEEISFFYILPLKNNVHVLFGGMLHVRKYVKSVATLWQGLSSLFVQSNGPGYWTWAFSPHFTGF